MDTTKLKKFAQFARRTLMEQVGAKLESVRANGAAAQREHPEAFKKLETAIKELGEAQVIERVAYIWFNRFSALRFLDVNDLNPVRVVSPVPGQFQPEILVDAKAGNINDQLVPEATRRQVRDLLDGQTPSPDAQAEAYRLLLVAVCNSWRGAMPFLFERIDDYTELLLPADLLSNASVLAYLREAMTPDVCKDVEVIGWLYQFYISEKKDLVFAGLKQNKKITAENIPAATQLFTPHWIVRYLVENSLGRLWLLNRPGSKLAERMEYYIAPEEPETDFLKISKPEEIRVCDPACGSGHMLTYAFDLLYAIYEEEGYEADKIPALILANNLTGVEIDDRAGALAAFALAMKAAARLGRRRFLRMEAKPDICVMQDVRFKDDEIPTYISKIGRDLFTDGLIETMKQFDQAKNFGSLIVPKLKSVEEVRKRIAGADLQGNLFIRDVHERVQKVLEMAEALSARYHVVVANPPYMSRSNMNPVLKAWVEKNFPVGKHDLFAAFILRCLSLSFPKAFAALVTIQNWMFLSSFEELRESILASSYFANLVQVGYNSFPELNSKVVQASAFVLGISNNDRTGEFVDLNDAPQSSDKHEIFRDKLKDRIFYIANSVTFKRLPGEPIAYWVSDKFAALFKGQSSDEVIDLREGIHTGDNERFLRFWHEPSSSSFVRGAVSEREVDESGKWVPYNKGGSYRKWYGNNDLVISWDRQSRIEMEKLSGHVRPSKGLYFKEGGTWSALTSGYFGIRYYPAGHLFDSKGQVAVGENHLPIIGQFNTNLFQSLAKTIMPTLDYKCGDVKKLPFLPEASLMTAATRDAIHLGRSDWDSYETSWDFSTFPLLAPPHRGATLAASYAKLRAHWEEMTSEMRRLEEENNRIFIDAYGLQDELTPQVPLEEITLTCNPAYSIGVGKTDAEREGALLARTMSEFLSYAVGCMFGRYSLDAPGLILANQGERLEDYLSRVPAPSFEPDKDNVIPVLDGEWFADDITERFRRFLRVTFGDERFRENLAFIEAQIGDIRKYFTKGFYEDHLKRYKKRPIYWMFSSPKGTFQALIYMHRYRPDTVSVLRNEYLVEFIRKLEAERAKLAKLEGDPSATQAQRTRALKDTAVVAKQIAELEEWEREVIFPLAQAKIEIDLDEGVKRNYPQFGAALKPIKGLEAADE